MLLNIFELAAKLTVVAPTPAEIESATQGLSELKEVSRPHDFYTYCANWKLAPWIYTQLKRLNLIRLLNAEVVAEFKADFEKISAQNTKRNETAAIFLKAFKEEGIEVIVLKGNYLAHTAYHEVGYKRMNDFDILIHKKDWSRIQDVYLRLGYIPLGFGWSGEKEDPASFSHVGMSFISSDFSCIIGSQWGLKSPTTAFTVNIQEAWETAIDFDFCGIPVKALSPEYNLLHLILHMGVYKCGIRDCMDVYNLVRSQTIDQALLLKIIRQSNAVEKAVFTFTLCNLCSPTFSNEFIARIGSKTRGFLATRLKRRLEAASATGDFQVSYNDYFQDIEKQVIYFNLFPKFHVKLVFYVKILRMIYWPKMKFALRLNDRNQAPTLVNTLVSRVKAPYFVFSLIAQEIGWKFTILLFLKLFVDLLISLKNYVVHTESYFDYLNKKGIDPQAIQKAVINIQ